jgi:hypothetical protein
MKTQVRALTLLLILHSTANLSAAPLIVTATFQQGTAGYSGTLDRRIAANAASHVNGADVNTETTSYFIDGGSSALNDAGVTQGLIRFDNIVGVGGVPAGAKVISATVDMVTGPTSNAQSGGAYNLYQLATAFDATSTWTDTFGGDGLAGDVGDLLGSFEDLAVSTPATARADGAVQQWVDGAPNLGFGIRSDRNTDGWSPNTTGAPTVANRPRLTVNYTVDPLVQIKSYQNGVNAYSGATDLRLNDTVIGSAVEDTFIDGFSAAPSPDQPYLLRFDGLDLSYAQVFKAELVLTSGFASANADSAGPFTVHQMLQDWSTSTTYADLDSNADPTLNDLNELLAAGRIAPAGATATGMNDTEVIHIDVTSIVENWRAGQANYGFYLGTVDTDNGWQIFTTGAANAGFRPELRIMGVQVPEPSSAALLLAAAALSQRVIRRR